MLQHKLMHAPRAAALLIGQATAGSRQGVVLVRASMYLCLKTGHGLVLSILQLLLVSLPTTA
jgi:hypothetical protein